MNRKALALLGLSAAFGVLAADAPPRIAKSSAGPSPISDVYVIELQGAPLATPGAERQPREISSEQAQAKELIGQRLARSIEPIASFTHVLNGFAAKFSPAEAAQISALEAVKSVHASTNRTLATDAGPRFIGAGRVWASPLVDPQGNFAALGDLIFLSRFESSISAEDAIKLGSRATVGVVDSGVNQRSPAVSQNSAFGYLFSEVTTFGWCFGGGAATVGALCNRKFVGAWDFVDYLVENDPAVFELRGVEDENGHGTHTAATAVGNIWNGPIPAGQGARVWQSGVAPLARLAVYDACFTELATGRGLCSDVSLLQSIDRAVIDGRINVVNYSISGGEAPWSDVVSNAMLLANASGILVSASAGNEGPGTETVAHRGPWIMTVAASTHDRAFFRNASLSLVGPVAPPPNSVNRDAVQGNGPLLSSAIEGAIRRPASNLRACTAAGGLPAGSLQNSIALIERGDCAFAEKINNARSAGANSVVVFNNVAGSPFQMAGLEATQIPAVMISAADGAALSTYLAANPTATAVLGPANAMPVSDPTGADVVAAFSSRGSERLDVLKPDIAAPGVSVLAAFAGDEQSTEFLSGTSMAAPHAAGAAALLKSLKPMWTPEMIKSALMLTATSAMTLPGGAPAGPFDRGAGRVRVDLAATTGLVLREQFDSYVFANPAAGGDPSTLNLASYLNPRCGSGCAFQRTFTGVASTAPTYTPSLVGAAGTVTPSSFTVAAGERIVVSVALNGIVDPIVNARLVLTPNDPKSPTLSMPVVVGNLTGPIAQIAPRTLDLFGAAPEGQFVVRNVGTQPLTATQLVQGSQVGDLIAQPTDPARIGVPSDLFAGAGTGLYLADDFSLFTETTVRGVYADGFFDGGSLLANSGAVTAAIYRDANGQPNGHPESEATPPVWRCSAAPNASGVDVSANAIRIDLAQAGCGELTLAAGTYWLTVYATVPGAPPTPTWYWFGAGAAVDAPAKLIAPGGLFGPDVTQWTNATIADSRFGALAMSLAVDQRCDAPWFEVNPSMISLAPGESRTVDVQVDGSGLSAGRYLGFACFSTNVPAAPLEQVRLNYQKL
jgi:subtilisin family serine protease